VAARLGALGDDHVGARGRGALGLGDRADLAQHQRARVVGRGDERRGVGERVGDHAHALRQGRRRQRGRLVEVRDEADAHRAIGQVPGGADLGPQAVGVAERAADHPEAAARRHGRRQPGAGHHPHRCVEDRVLDSEQVAEPRPHDRGR
jgi:hypothetical protein